MASPSSPTKRKREVYTPEPDPALRSQLFVGGLLTPPSSQKKLNIGLNREESGNSIVRVSSPSRRLIAPLASEEDPFVVDAKRQAGIKAGPVNEGINDIPALHDVGPTGAAQVEVKEEQSSVEIGNIPSRNEVPTPVKQEPAIKGENASVKQEVLDRLGISDHIPVRLAPPVEGQYHLTFGEFEGSSLDEVPAWYLQQLDNTGDAERAPGLREALIKWASAWKIPSYGVELRDMPIYDINNTLYEDQQDGTLDIGTTVALKYHLLVREPEEPGQKYIHWIGNTFKRKTLFETVLERGDESYLKYMKDTHMAERPGNEDMAEALEYYHRVKAAEIKRQHPNADPDQDYNYRYHLKQSNRWNWRIQRGVPVGLGPLAYPTTLPVVSSVDPNAQFTRRCLGCGFRLATQDELTGFGI